MNDDKEAVASAVVSEIEELCSEMSQCGMQSACLGSLTDANEGKCYSVFSEPEQKIVADEVSLTQVLHGDEKLKPVKSERFRIALAVASSHLQLQSTHWARQQWDAADIHFPKISGVNESIMFDKPYVAADFNNIPGNTTQPPMVTDRSFACLGIMLLELLFGRSLESADLWDQFGWLERKTSPLHRLMVARRWADAVEDEVGHDFAAAVKWCLNDSPTMLQGDQWRHDLASRVVLPLQNCCNLISGILSQ